MTDSMISVYAVRFKVLRRQVQRGFSLIELMVSMVISMLIMGAILILFLDVTRTNDEMAKTNAQIENGRFAIELLRSDLAHAGFWNGYIPEFDDLSHDTVPSDYPTAVPDPCQALPWSATYIRNILGISVQAYEHSDLPAGCGALLANIQAGTDVLIVRHAATCEPGVGDCEPDSAGRLYFQASRCNSDPAPYVLGVAGFTLHQRTTVPAGLPNCASPLSTNFAPKRKFNSSIYYVRNYSLAPGDGIPTLMRSEFDLASGVLAHQPAQPLIEGIEAIRFEFGVDNLSKTGAAVNYASAIVWSDPATRTTPTNRGDGSPDGVFIRCTAAVPCSVDQLANTTAVRIHLLVRNLTPTSGYTDTKTYSLGAVNLGPFNDNFKRHVFSTTVRLVNISARRETP